jgi:F-type H+-transporting ATPase subunit a
MGKLEHELWIVQVVNQIFGPLVASAARPLGFTLDPHDAIPDYLVMCVVVVAFLTVVSLLIRSRLSVEHPGKLQIVAEDLVGAVVGMLRDNVGPKGPRYLPLIGAIGLFIFTANMLGKVPGFMSPTASINVTVGCAITVWVYYHLQGVKEQGIVKYLLHFAGYPQVPIAVGVIMFPIEILSHLSRVMSLSIRLFGNIFSEELVVLILASIIPLVVPLPMMALGVVTGTLQAFIFVLLTMIYLGGAVHAEHGHEEAAHAAHAESAAHAHA